MSQPDDAPPQFDAAQLIALFKQGDRAAIDEAYKRTFSRGLGLIVLIDFMADCGVGNFINGATDAELREAVARHNAAISLAQKAGFMPTTVAVATLSGHLEESDHEQVPGGFAHIPGPGDLLDE